MVKDLPMASVAEGNWKKGGLVEDELRLKMVSARQSFLDHSEDCGFYVE